MSDLLPLSIDHLIVLFFYFQYLPQFTILNKTLSMCFILQPESIDLDLNLPGKTKIGEELHSAEYSLVLLLVKKLAVIKTLALLAQGKGRLPR